MSRIINSNSGASSISIHGVNTTGGTGVLTEAVRDFYRFQLLYTNVLKQLSVYLGQYSVGNYDALIKSITENKKNLLLTSITSKTKYNNSKVTNLEGFMYDSSLFTSYKAFTINILNGLVASIEYYKERVIADTLNNELSVYKKILDNNSNEFLILDYLNKKKIELKPLDIEMVFDFGIELKPWYTEYLVTYGPPENGVFDENKMAVIVSNLIDGGVITFDEFINTLPK
jgi:hypothetical protein